MPKPLMPKATAVWLIDNTTLTFEQIGDLCELHSLEVQGIADEEVAVGIVGASPIETGELTQAEIARCQNDPSARLVMAKGELPVPVARSKEPALYAGLETSGSPGRHRLVAHPASRAWRCTDFQAGRHDEAGRSMRSANGSTGTCRT